jgi:RNA polymerase sigma factor (sigma-70 family)
VAGIASSRSPGTADAKSRRRAAEALIASHDAVFRRTARRYSICADDAEDAYQRSLEILLTKAPSIEADSLVRWMQTVTKREALAVRRQRERLLSGHGPSSDDEDRDPLDAIASELAGPSERAASRERVARSGEALRALKPQEMRALTLKAQGYSYTEIGEITGWTYTKINRCMAEGRKRFLEVFADIEAGHRCERFATALSALADGESPNGLSDELELHLRACGSCRARLRAFRAIPNRVLELAPLPLTDQASGGAMSAWIGERVATVSEKAREVGFAVLSRGSASESATPFVASGGTRGAGMAALGKVLALCGATAAGGAACVASGVVDTAAVGLGREGERPVAIEKPAEAERPVESPIDQGEVAPEPAPPDAGPEPVEADASAEPAPTPAEQASQNFGFESTPADSSASSGAGSSASGGSSEFGGPSSAGGSSGGGSSSGGFGFEKG